MGIRLVYIRQEDQKHFYADTSFSYLHWVKILADDGEFDEVKWYGSDSKGELYVSNNKGHSYHRVKEGD